MADQENNPYTVVVGVSATSKSRAALTWAQSQAQHFGGRLIAVRAWRMAYPQTLPSGSADVDLPKPEVVEERARKVLEADVAEVLGEDHDAEIHLVRGGKLKVLLKASAGADLLVVDAPQQLFAGPAFAHRLVYAASCPVVAMPPALTAEGPAVRSRASSKSAEQGQEAIGASREYPTMRF